MKVQKGCISRNKRMHDTLGVKAFRGQGASRKERHGEEKKENPNGKGANEDGEAQKDYGSVQRADRKILGERRGGGVMKLA